MPAGSDNQFKASRGYKSSVFAGISIPCSLENRMSRVPRHKNMKTATRNEKLNTSIFFCASRIFLQVRFFCIMSWSMPNITIVINMPARNCLKKLFSDLQSQKNVLDDGSDEILSAMVVRFNPRL